MKRLVFAILLVVAVGTAVFLALNRPGAEAVNGATYIVDSTGDGDDFITDGVCDDGSGKCTLRAAMQEVNASAGADTIIFDTAVFPPPPSSPATITLSKNLTPLSTGDDTVDGSSAGVIVDGVWAWDCLIVISSNNTIKGLNITSCPVGVWIGNGAQNNTIGGGSAGEGNVISGNSRGVMIEGAGTNGNVVKGNYIVGTGDHGVFITLGAQGNTVGGSSAGEGNVVSGYADSGVAILGAGTNGNVVKGNYVGINADGTPAIPNNVGVAISDGAQGNTIGGATAGEGNVISGNVEDGVRISDSGTNGNSVIGNRISNNARGIRISGGAQSNIIQGNVISGSTKLDGVSIWGSGTNGNEVKGNWIGTSDTGVPEPNKVRGVGIGDGAQGNVVGGTDPDEGNTIAFNTEAGVFVQEGALYNTIRGNSIHSNGDKGIELASGGNAGLAPPTITGFGSVMGTACANCEVDIYSDDEDEGRVYEGSTTADGDGNWSFPDSPQGPNVTATATDGGGNTSEFSAPMAVPEPTPSPSPTPSPTPEATRSLQWSAGWHNATWSGASTPEEAFACAAGNYAAAYRLVSGGWERYFPDRPDISNMTDLEQYDAFLILVTGDVTCEMPVADASGTERTLAWGVGWQNDGWTGADGTAPEDAFACADGSYAAAYRLVGGGWERYFPDRPDISNMGSLDKYDAFLILVTAPVSCTMAIAP
jgi:parallel beta-helix repeat protein